MISEIRRAGTSQIIESVEIKNLYTLWKKCRLYNGYNTFKNSKFVLSHICPVSNENGFIALLDPENLIITSRSYNALRKNSWDGFSGRYLPASKKMAIFDVDKSTSKSSVVTMIRNLCVGFDEFITEAKLTLTATAKLHNKLAKLGDPYPEWTPYEDLVAALDMHRGIATTETVSFHSESESIVYLNECARIGAYCSFNRLQEYSNGIRLSAEINWHSLHTKHKKGKVVWIAKNGWKGLGVSWRYYQEIIKPEEFDPDLHSEIMPESWNDKMPWNGHYYHNGEFYVPYHCF